MSSKTSAINRPQSGHTLIVCDQVSRIHCVYWIKCCTECCVTGVRWPHMVTVTRRPSEYVADWMNAGATWIGGCCSVRPSDITNIRSAMHRHLSSGPTSPTN